MTNTIIKIPGELPTIFVNKHLCFGEVLQYVKEKFPWIEKAEMKYVHSTGDNYKTATCSREKYYIDVLHERFIEII